MESISKRYDNILKTLFQKCLESVGKDRINSDVVKEKYKSYAQYQIQKANSKVKIVMDNQFGQAILRKIKTDQKKYISDFKKLQNSIKFTSFLNIHLGQIGFITIRMKKKIQEQYKRIQNSREYKLNSRIVVLQKSDNIEDFRQELFSILYPTRQDIDLQDQQQLKKLYRQFYEHSFKNLDRRLFVKIDSLITKFEPNKQEIFDKQFMNQIDQYFGHEVGKDDFQIQINKKLMSIAESECLESNQQRKQMLEEHFQEIKKILNKFSGMKLFTQSLKLNLYVSKFGSIISGFATQNTDVDITILTNCYINQIKFLQYLQSFIKAQFKQKKVKNQTRFIKAARIPVLKLKIQSKNGDVQIDLIVNNILGIVNSKFLSVYAQIPWIKHLGILIKAWGKNKDLVQEQLFSSYSLNLMLIHFLYQTGRVNLIMDARQRNLQKTPHFTYKRVSKDEQQKFNVYFQYKTSKQDVTSIKRANIYQILSQFFQYFGQNGKHWKHSNQQSIISVDGSKDKLFQQKYLFTIKDPFDQMHNPGRVLASQRNKVIPKFSFASETMGDRKLQDIQYLFK